MDTDHALVQVGGWFSSHEAAHLAGVSYRQLDHWARKQCVSPSVRSAAGTGSRRAYSYQDVVALGVARALRSAGLGLPQIQPILAELRSGILDEDAAQLVVDGAGVTITHSGAEVVSLLDRVDGAVTVVSLRRIRAEIAERLAGTRPGAAEAVLVEAS